MGDRRDFLVRIQIKDEHGNITGEIDAISFKGLLAIAHDEGLIKLKSVLVQLPSKDNEYTAIVYASVRTRKGAFSATGDANPKNVNPAVAPHYIRVAETRAIARAFRLAVNIGEVALEELGGNFAFPGSTPSVAPRVEAPVHREPAPPQSATDSGPRVYGERFRGRDRDPSRAEPSDRRLMSEEQRKLLFRLAFDLGASRDTARERVLDALGVERLEHATRVEASRAIDALKRERQEQGNGAGQNGTNGHNGAANHG